MRLVIDLQGAQGSNRQRGIGRYTLSLTKAILRNRGKHEVILALNGLFLESIESIRAEFDGLLPQEQICVWYVPESVCSLDSGNGWRRKSAELVRESFLASLNPDVVLVTSLFEGLIDDVVTSIGTLSLNVPTAVILYDLIPFIHRQPYLENSDVESWYENKLDHLRRGNLFLAISESSRQEGINYLGFPEDISVNISTAADSHFQVQSISSEQEAVIREKYGLQQSYVMYTGGIDHRKNIEGLIRAYASLPKTLRAQHQLAIVCSIQSKDKSRLEELAKEHKLKNHELVLTGFIPEDDLLALYSLCKVFVFPSWHEGFGLPALEAMSCGRAVIGSNKSSVPEVIGKEEALFDPMDDQSIAEKLIQVLNDDGFRAELEQHGLNQAKKFTWDKSAVKAINAFESLYEKYKTTKTITPIQSRRPKMAYVSPLPPERSGISDYSAELLPELSRHYDIDLIVAQDSIDSAWVNANCVIRSVDWFRAHATNYERVLYHFGNSHFHQHMFSLLRDIPGVVVLHDFFLSGIVAHMDVHGFNPDSWGVELYSAHGYGAVKERYHVADTADVVWKYPCNLSVLENAKGIIVHSDNSRRLATQWYGEEIDNNWVIIPHLRVSAVESNRASARRALNLGVDDFVVCSFGLLGPSKLNHRLLDAWLASDLSKDKNCILVFVGENHNDEYGQKLIKIIRTSKADKRIHITGWADTTIFQYYLAAADIGVQLRTLSRGETSGTVLDCMNHGLPTIVNSNGSMADLDGRDIWKLPDDFTDTQLIQALEVLWRDTAKREQLSKSAKNTIINQHSPRRCADQYYAAIEECFQNSVTDIHSLTNAISRQDCAPADNESLLSLAEKIALSVSLRLTSRQLLVDVSELVQRDSKSGIQRVVRSILRELLLHPPEGLRIEPVYATTEHGYRYARRFTLGFLDCPVDILSDELIEYRAGDVFLGLDLQPQVVSAQQAFYQQLRRHGVTVQFVVYDLLCVLMPQYFVEGAAEGHARWLDVVAESDGAVCISKAVADELGVWFKKYGPERLRPFNISWFHLGADVNNSVPSRGIPNNANAVLKSLSTRNSFLMVGTIEPRKGHAQTLAAFEQLWVDGVDVNLVIVGRQGWMVEELIEKLRLHSEMGKHLFWLEGISDEYLEKVYAASTCLIAASEGEGFGLPLIEAAQYKLPIIARDIPVFREVVARYATYFSGGSADDISETIRAWLFDFKERRGQSPEDISWLTWEESASQLMDALLKT